MAGRILQYTTRVALLGFVLAVLEAFDEEQPARATAPAVTIPEIRRSL